VCTPQYPSGSPMEWQQRIGKEPDIQQSNLDKWEGIYNEAKRLEEEVEELLAGAFEEDPLETLDAYCDIKFIFMNMENRLRKYGFDVDGAFKEVCYNNDLKYTTDFKVVNKWYDAKKLALGMDGYDLYIHDEVTPSGRYYCLKRERDQKVMKPTDHPRINLVPYLSETM